MTAEERNAKVSKPSVHYRQAKPHAEKRCGTCVMFRPAGSACTLVAGLIHAEMVCDRYEAKK